MLQTTENFIQLENSFDDIINDFALIESSEKNKINNYVESFYSRISRLKKLNAKLLKSTVNNEEVMARKSN